MSKVPPIGPDSEERLATALEQAYLACLHDGAVPNEALAKAAAEHAVPPGQVKLLTYAYNTGATERLRTLGKTAAERMQAFPLATTAGILQHLAPDGIKRALALEQPDPAYTAPPALPAITKTASTKLAPNEDEYVRSELKGNSWRSLRSGRWAAGWKERDEARRKAETSRFDMQNAFDRMLDKNAALVGYFQTHAARPLAEVRAHAEVMFGKQAQTILDGVAERVPVRLRGPLPLVPAPATPHQPPYSFIAGVIKAAGEYLDRQREAQAAQQLADDAEVILKTAVQLESELRQGGEKAGFFPVLFGSALGTAAVQDVRNRLPIQKSLDQLREKALQQITDPEHESRLRNLQSETMLSDLLANDEVIAGYDPNEVLDNFNEIARLGPRISSQPAVVRALLRKRLQQGSPDPFELDLVLKMENNLRSRDRGPGGADAAGTL